LQGNWVPSVVMGGGHGTQTAGSGAQELLDLLTVKTARELGFDMSIHPPPRVAMPSRSDGCEAVIQLCLCLEYQNERLGKKHWEDGP
jgi:hypothetical protein